MSNRSDKEELWCPAFLLSMYSASGATDHKTTEITVCCSHSSILPTWTPHPETISEGQHNCPLLNQCSKHISYLSTTFLFWWGSSVEIHWSRPACRDDLGCHWSQRLSTRSQPLSVNCRHRVEDKCEMEKNIYTSSLFACYSQWQVTKLVTSKVYPHIVSGWS